MIHIEGFIYDDGDGMRIKNGNTIAEHIACEIEERTKTIERSRFDINTGCEDMFKKFFRENKDEVKNRVDILEDQINKQKVNLDSYDSRITGIIDENKRLKRILENYIPGKITYKNMSEYSLFTYHRDAWCFIYKDGKEFCINGMRLNEPSFTERNDSSQKDIIYVKDNVSIDEKTEYREYVIDLNNCTFIREK